MAIYSGKSETFRTSGGKAAQRLPVTFFGIKLTTKSDVVSNFRGFQFSAASLQSANWKLKIENCLTVFSSPLQPSVPVRFRIGRLRCQNRRFRKSALPGLY